MVPPDRATRSKRSGLALIADAEGDAERAFATLRDARARSTRLADPYVWLDAHILDAMCVLGRKHGHPATRSWIDALREVASRAGMRELTARALLHSAALGSTGDADAADLLAAEIDNPDLHVLIRAARGERRRGGTRPPSPRRAPAPGTAGSAPPADR